MQVGSPLVRQCVLLRTLCARHYGVSVKELAGELSVSGKTIRRDLHTFQEAGFPLKGNRRGFRPQEVASRPIASQARAVVCF